MYFLEAFPINETHLDSSKCISDIKRSRNIKISLYYGASVLLNNFVLNH